jgi:deoxyinosine 3'endonuclease (endonuclease V)
MLQLHHQHPWGVSPAEAREIQRGLCRLVETTDRLADIATVAGVKPIVVSSGHRVSLETAVDLVMRCTTRYRLPETTRRADKLASNR